MKRYFITGLIILLPLAVTLSIAAFFFNLLTEPLAGAVSYVLNRYHIFTGSSQFQYFISQVLILIFFLLFTIGVGMITRYFFVKSLFSLWDYLIHKIPLIRSIYRTSQDVVHTLFTSKESAFKQVVLAPYPYPGCYAIGFMTQRDISAFGGSKVSVFMPTTPNPTSGFLMLYEENELIYLDMKVEDAFKYVISCGVIDIPFNITEMNRL